MKRALVSVTNKEGIVEFAKGLEELGFEVVSTGGTYKKLLEAGVKAIEIDDVTGFPEILDGRVKTLHPKVHGGILFRRDVEEHVKTVEEMGITPIDLVCCNLYEFEKALKAGKPMAEMIENIDIGGPSMIRSAAKNFKDVLIVTDPKDYDAVLEAIREDKTDFEFRMNLAYMYIGNTFRINQIITAFCLASFLEVCFELGCTPVREYLVKSDTDRIHIGIEDGVPACLIFPSAFFVLLTGHKVHIDSVLG